MSIFKSSHRQSPDTSPTTNYVVKTAIRMALQKVV